MVTKHIPEFSTEEEAETWMLESLDVEEIDWYRFAYIDDITAMKQYNALRNNGEGKPFDEEVYINNVLATIGCHY